MYLVSVSSDSVHIHLSGACSGCPGASVTREKILAPILLAVAPKARLVVTTGVNAPAGATKIESDGDGAATDTKADAKSETKSEKSEKK
jgi:hypothetical protein